MQGATGVLLVVMLKGDGQIVNRRLGIRLGHEGDVVALHGFQEALGHPVALRAALILNYFRARKQFSSGVIEGLNNKAKITMRKAYGFRILPDFQGNELHKRLRLTLQEPCPMPRSGE